jgi:hypothetical protein
MTGGAEGQAKHGNFAYPKSAVEDWGVEGLRDGQARLFRVIAASYGQILIGITI